MTIRYHHGQVAVQTEANTLPVAEMLADWVGPVVEFCRTADMIVLAFPDSPAGMRFMAVSGPAPIVEILGPAEALVRVDVDPYLLLDGDVQCGGLAISMAVARRARLNGRVSPSDDGLIIEPDEAFTNCRKYVVPSEALGESLITGPSQREGISISDPWVAHVLERAETAFLASISPDGVIDVSHRGGEPGFLEFDAAAEMLDWDEYVGDGMFKSTGNIRATRRFVLCVLDLPTGDALELHGSATYTTLRTAKEARTGGLERHADPYPVQGRMACSLERAYRLEAFTHPRRRLAHRERITSCSTTDVQAPQ